MNAVESSVEERRFLRVACGWPAALVLAGILTVMGARGASAGPPQAPRTLFALPEPVVAFAYADGKVAWIGEADCGPSVAPLAGPPAPKLDRSGCRRLTIQGAEEGVLAFDGDRTLWSDELFSNGGASHVLLTVAQANPHAVQVGSSTDSSDADPALTPYRALENWRRARLVMVEEPVCFSGGCGVEFRLLGSTLAPLDIQVATVDAVLPDSLVSAFHAKPPEQPARVPGLLAIPPTQ